MCELSCGRPSSRECRVPGLGANDIVMCGRRMCHECSVFVQTAGGGAGGTSGYICLDCDEHDRSRRCRKKAWSFVCTGLGLALLALFWTYMTGTGFFDNTSGLDSTVSDATSRGSALATAGGAAFVWLYSPFDALPGRTLFV